MIPDFLLRFFIRQIAKDIKLEASPMPETPWYKNKSTLSHIFSALVATVVAATDVVTHDFNHTLPGWLVKAGALVMTFASALGVYDNHSN